MNELHLETSPYLLQHATNPVFWKSWNPKTLALANENNKLLIVSIGYSACHWCHVMEHETFKSEEVAQVMNAHFISIKVDREERPDIDAVYMKAVQIMTRRGGWPLNVVCLPNGKPVWCGTYFRTNEWMDYLQQLENLYATQPEKLIDYAQKLQEGIEVISAVSSIKNQDDIENFDLKKVENLISKWEENFDYQFGGMNYAPKFMMPTNYSFLLQFAHLTQNKKLLDYIHLTATKMAFGGVFDVVDGGFSRYSTDVKWHVPHFEKMLYDNAQLVSFYCDLYKATKNNLYKNVVEKTLKFVEKEFLNSENGFYSALDADSLNEKNQLEEGAFYIWKKSELKAILKDDFQLFAQVFNINDFGFWENDNYVLIQNKTLEEIANNNAISVLELENKKRIWEESLYAIREKRSKPKLDDKCLCSWNALMLKGFVDAYKAFLEKKYLDIALKNADFIVNKFLTPEGNLYHNYKNGKTTINGFLEDYCFVIDAFISLYQVTLNENWLHISKQLTDYCFDNFYDEKQRFFRFTSIQDAQLVANHFEIEDNVIPASNSVMASNLVILSVYFENAYYEKVAKQMVTCIMPKIDDVSAYTNWLKVWFYFSNHCQELAICGNEAVKYIAQINAMYMANCIVSGSEKPSVLPFLKHRFVENETLFYHCKNKTCEKPTAEFKEFISKL